MGNSCLSKPGIRTKAKPIEYIDNEISRIAGEMLDTLYDACRSGTCSATSRIIDTLSCIDVTGEKAGERVFINPHIIEERGEIMEEGCLSFQM